MVSALPLKPFSATRRRSALALATLGAWPFLRAEAQSFANARPIDVSDVRATMLAAYRFLHENPETGMKEVEARRYLMDKLSRLPGLRLVDLPSLPTALLGILDTGRPGATLALRAELDARPLDAGQVEPAEHDPRSRLDGMMHNCGHDAHAAMLLGAATYISGHVSSFVGRIAFLFQPAEETPGGADDIVSGGVLRDLEVSAIFAQHCTPRLKVGRVTLVRGTPLAGSTAFTIKLRGRESHAAIPHQGSDLTMLASRIIAELSLFPARRVDIANRPLVISVTQMSTNAQTRNGLPSEVDLTGTIRGFESILLPSADGPPLIDTLQNRISALAAMDGATATIVATPGSPPTRNDDALFDAAYPALQHVFGETLTSPFSRGMFSEDFAFYTEQLPALYFGLGIAKDGLGEADTHTRHFTLHPTSLEVGARLLVALARDVGPLLPRRRG